MDLKKRKLGGILMSVSKISKVEQILKASHLKITEQRLAILNFLQDNTSHPTANDILIALQTYFPSLTLKEINENLELFVEKQLIRKISITPNLTRFDGNLQSHYHVICTHCHKATDFNYPSFIDIESIASQITKHQVYTHELMLFGICQQCSHADCF